jgi:hypothetical protein
LVPGLIKRVPNFYTYFNEYAVTAPSFILIIAPFGFFFKGPRYG